MRIAIMGAGALGGYFGARLAGAGADVTLIARGAHLRAMQADGLRVISPKGDGFVPPETLQASGDPGAIGPVDLVLLFVKLPDVAGALAAMAPMMGAATRIATFQNGVSAPAMAAEAYGAGRVIPGVARIPAVISAPGVIQHRSGDDPLAFGPLAPESGPHAEALLAAFRAAHVSAEIAPDIEVALWEKFVMQSATAAVTCLTRLDFGGVRAHAASADLMRRAMEETAAVGRAECSRLAPDVAARQYQAFEAMPGGVKASMLDDIEAGKPLELDWISGEVVRLGRKHGIATPVHEVAMGALGPYAEGRPAG